jgi:hypothetical protein
VQTPFFSEMIKTENNKNYFLYYTFLTTVKKQSFTEGPMVVEQDMISLDRSELQPKPKYGEGTYSLFKKNLPSIKVQK